MIRTYRRVSTAFNQWLSDCLPRQREDYVILTDFVEYFRVFPAPIPSVRRMCTGFNVIEFFLYDIQFLEAAESIDIF